jgi:hypothetical protein
MKRESLVVALVALACSRTTLDEPPTGAWPPPRVAHATECVASYPALKSCSGLRVVSAKQPIALDAAFVDDDSAELVTERGGGLEILGAGQLVHLDLVGTPPVATPRAPVTLLAPDHHAFMGAATDGHLLFACAEHDNGFPVVDESIRDESNALLASFDLPRSIQEYCVVGARDGLALTAYDAVSYSESDHPGAVVLEDASGIRWWRGGLGAPFGAAAYGCGFAYVAPTDGRWAPPGTVTMLPLDGAPEVSVPLDNLWEGPLYRWPWDARTVALLTRGNNYDDPSASCPIRIDLVRDDGTSTKVTFDHDCAIPIASEGDDPAAFAMATFGAVLHDGAGNFQLLAANAKPIGAPVSVPLIPYTSDVVMGAVGDFVVVLTAEDDQRQGNVVVSQVVLGCEP